MSDLLAVYRLDQTQYFTAAVAERNDIEQYNLRYKNLIITWILIINATLLKLRESLEQEIDFRHQDIIPDESSQFVTMIIKQDLENKQSPNKDKKSKTKELSGSQNVPVNLTLTMVMEEQINLTVTLVIKDNGSNDKEGESDDNTERSSNEEHMYALLTGYQNIGDEFEIEDMDPYKIVNGSSLMHVTIFDARWRQIKLTQTLNHQQ